MNQHSLPTIGVAALVAGAYLLQVACDACVRQPALNSNDGAQVVSANSPAGVAEATRNPVATPSLPDSSARVASGPGPTKEQIEHDAEYYRRLAKAQGSTIGNGPDDLWIWVQAKFGLMRMRTAPTIIIDVDQAVVTLRGTVQTKQDALTAVATVRGIDGVRDVINQLAIVNP